jgi:EAL and modified HD-GYP domain-containing signal transduction protein
VQTVHLARQPIFDRRFRVFAYELLFRGHGLEQSSVTDPDAATCEVITSSIVDVGLETLVGNHLAFVNMTRGFLAGELPLPEVKDQLVLEILEDIVPDPALLDSVRGLVRAGYRIALDDFQLGRGFDDLLELAEFVKLDVVALSAADLEAHVQHLRRYPARLLAEKVENHDLLERCLALGFDYFQGYFFCRPQLVSNPRLSPNRLAVLRLLARLQDPALEMAELQALVASDAELVYQLMRFLNSAYCGLRSTVRSIQDAVVLVGTDAIRRWSALLAMSRLVDDQPAELVVVALVRARMCELLGEQRDEPGERHFTVGLLSVLDTLLSRPMAAALADLPLDETIKQALTGRTGSAGGVLQAVERYEHGELDPAVDAELLRRSYLAALGWAWELQRGLGLEGG